MPAAIWRRELARRFRRRSARPAPRPGRRGFPPALLTAAAGLGLAALLIGAFQARLRPLVAEAARAQAQNTITALLERAVSDSLARREVGYADFVTIQRDEGGAITALTTDTAALNRLRSELTGEILQVLEGVDVSAVSIPLGSLLDFEPVWARGPSIKARALSVGTVTAEFESSFTSAGVNQTLHRIWLDISVPITVLLPGERIEVPVHTRLCAAETVIVGEVPRAYLQLDSSAAG